MKLLFSVFLFLLTFKLFSQVSLVKDINTVDQSYIYSFCSVNNNLFFHATDSINGNELWVSDGTEAGTYMVEDIFPGPYGSSPSNIFLPGDPYGTEYNGVYMFVANDGIHGDELWKSDGTQAGTMLVKDINPGSANSEIYSFVSYNGVLYFQANDGVHGLELWRSDGTLAGTYMVIDLDPTPFNYPQSFCVYNGYIYFNSRDGSSGFELWRTDGTAIGTQLVKDINPGSSDSFPSYLIVLNNLLYFFANDGIHSGELWRSDGTETGTFMLTDLNVGYYVNNFAVLDSIVLFSGSSSLTENYELWKTDGTPNNTTLVKEINPIGSSFPNDFIEFQGEIYFTATDTVNGKELWKTDGTNTGTILVKDIKPGIANSNPNNLLKFQNKLYFSASSPGKGYELWATDGTLCETQIVEEINPGNLNSTSIFVWPGKNLNIKVIDSIIYFAATRYDIGNELWKLVPQNTSYLSYSPIQYETSCLSYTWNINNVTYTNSGIYVDTLIDYYGCDSAIVTLDLTITNYWYDTINVTSCNEYNFNGLILNSSGIYSDTLINPFGCDTIITLQLQVFQSTSSTINITECSQFNFNGTILTNSGVYIDTIQNSNNCDSIINLNLTISPTFSFYNSITSCQSYTWAQNNQTYYNSGIYYDTLNTINGCDSLFILNLTINSVNLNFDTIVECIQYNWPFNGQTYYSSGNYSDTLINIFGCDSIMNLNLTIIPLIISQTNTFSSPSSYTSCNGQLAITTTGNSNFELNIDGGAPFTSSGYSLQTNLCPGIHELSVIDFCGDTVSEPFVIPVDSNYVFNNPFIDSIAVDSLGTTITNCDIYYNSIDTAYIDSLWATGNQVNVIWNIVDSNGSNLDTTTYDLMNGSGVYWLQLSVFCPTKSTEDYFTVTQAIYFGNGGAYLVGLEDNPEPENSIGLYPNPTFNSVTITFTSNSTARVQLIDAQGKFIQESVIVSGDQMSLENLERGVYFLNVEINGEKTNRKIIRQ
jgi:ELWxxDGT repeat protein